MAKKEKKQKKETKIAGANTGSKKFKNKKKKKLNEQKEEILMNDFTDGIYFISLINNGNKYYSKKIIKVHY